MWKTETIGEVRMATISFKCPNCGGDLVFDPSTGKYKCEFCLSLFTQAELEQLEADRAEDTVVQQKGCEYAYLPEPEFRQLRIQTVAVDAAPSPPSSVETFFR